MTDKEKQLEEELAIIKTQYRELQELRNDNIQNYLDQENMLVRQNKELHQEIARLKAALSGKIAKPKTGEQPPHHIELLDYGKLCVCDYGDTDKIIEYVIILAKKINQLISAHNARTE